MAKNKTVTKPEKKLTATQKIKALEDRVLAYDQKFAVMAQELDRINSYMTGIGRRLNAVIEVAEKGGEIKTDAVNELLITQNVTDLKDKVKFLVEKGAIVKSETGVITEQSFIVGKEMDGEEIINPRLQFAVNTIDKPIQDQLMGKKLNESIVFNEGEPAFIIEEIFEVVSK